MWTDFDENMMNLVEMISDLIYKPEINKDAFYEFLIDSNYPHANIHTYGEFLDNHGLKIPIGYKKENEYVIEYFGSDDGQFIPEGIYIMCGEPGNIMHLSEYYLFINPVFRVNNEDNYKLFRENKDNIIRRYNQFQNY